MAKQKEIKIELETEDKDFIDIKESEDMQKKGFKVVEIKVIDGVKKHRLEKDN